MSIFITDGPIAICDRCHKKVLRRTLGPDRDKPGLMVCKTGGCNDERDPWRQAWHPKDADIHVERPRPEQALDKPTTQTQVDENGRVVEGAIDNPLVQKPSST